MAAVSVLYILLNADICYEIKELLVKYSVLPLPVRAVYIGKL